MKKSLGVGSKIGTLTITKVWKDAKYNVRVDALCAKCLVERHYMAWSLLARFKRDHLSCTSRACRNAHASKPEVYSYTPKTFRGPKLPPEKRADFVEALRAYATTGVRSSTIEEHFGISRPMLHNWASRARAVGGVEKLLKRLGWTE